MSFLLGLTGSIGMGKSTTADMFREAGVPVWDADATVAKLYGKSGAAVAPLSALNRGLIQNDAVDREALKNWVKKDPNALNRLESLIHPLVAADRAEFIDDHAEQSLIVCDIPLLYETGADQWLDAVLVVTTDAETQKARVMGRAGMDPALFDRILARQMPNSEKIARADYVIETNSFEGARKAVHDLINDLTARTL
ncbi:MAG: dephospho-CoA kinase [Rhodobacteraceae bacterium]|uniref:dephospho-CoA kinase n=1 Tax=Roseovarius sp. 10 TaxID=3080563 RepID=UPI00193674A8|nr:dephospho-CoA kinase [Roseovarius sp. 10]MBE1289887.1 dephospho-CoA kinase [Paracoccaceae bacterium]MDV7202032.1 dephospho-CoA kinase [Roseovarius sp. 10]QPI84785.1 dephospho-CoA kinase [Rhodobacterales bacterium HKCCA1288]